MNAVHAAAAAGTPAGVGADDGGQRCLCKGVGAVRWWCQRVWLMVEHVLLQASSVAGEHIFVNLRARQHKHHHVSTVPQVPCLQQP